MKNRECNYLIKDVKEIIEHPKYRFIRELLQGDIPVEEVMRAYDIYPSIADTGPEVYGLVYRARSGNYHVVVNQMLSQKVREEIFYHELYHILFDCPKDKYIIGIDRQRHVMEMSADLFYKLAAAALEA